VLSAGHGKEKIRQSTAVCSVLKHLRTAFEKQSKEQSFETARGTHSRTLIFSIFPWRRGAPASASPGVVNTDERRLNQNAIWISVCPPSLPIAI